MRTVKNWAEIKDWPSGFRSPRRNVMVRSKHGVHILASGWGTGDDVEVFHENGTFYVLSVRRNFPYVGLACFISPPTHKRPTDEDRDSLASNCYKLKPTEPTNEIFAQGDEQIADCLGDNALDKLSVMTIAKRLAEWVAT